MIGAAMMLALLVAQAPQAAPRDRVASAAAEATGQLAGRVVSPENAPLRRAIVRLSSAGLPAPRIVRTDLEGRYAFATLPAGSFTVKASKPGYLTLDYGQRRPFEQGRRLELKASEKLRGVDVILPKAAAISGTIVDDAGEPVFRMWVAVARSAYRDGRRRLSRVALTATNDAGEFRIAGLAPGDYYVVANEGDVRVNEAADEPFGFETTYYPGTSNPSEAQPVHVSLGQEVVNLNLPVLAARTSILTGRVVDPTGSPLTSLRVSLSEPAASVLAAGNVFGGAPVLPDGRFRIAGVRPGRWLLFGSSGSTAQGYLPIDIGAGETREVTLVVGPGGTLGGRVVSETGAPLPAAAMAATELRLSAPLEAQLTSYRPVKPRPDGAFEWTSVIGPVLLRPSRLPDGYWLKGIKRGDADVSDTPVEMTHRAAVSDLTVVLAEGAATLSGTATENGKPQSDYTVILFPEQKASPRALERLVWVGRPDHTGAYRLAGIPPGTWMVAAIDFIEEGQWLDPAFLESLRSTAVKMEFQPQQQMKIDISIKKY
jgi:Carboxypeptidase regulatory-like domain